MLEFNAQQASPSSKKPSASVSSFCVVLRIVCNNKPRKKAHIPSFGLRGREKWRFANIDTWGHR
jgi:hypothetical protein